MMIIITTTVTIGIPVVTVVNNIHSNNSKSSYRYAS